MRYIHNKRTLHIAWGITNSLFSVPLPVIEIINFLSCQFDTSVKYTRIINLPTDLYLYTCIYPLSTCVQVYNAVCVARRYGLHSLRPASIFVPACPQPSSLTVITNASSDVSSLVGTFATL